MRIVIALCLLAIFCTADATFINIRMRQIQNEKAGIENTIRLLERNRDSVEQDVDLAIMKQWLLTMDKYEKYASPILETIRKEVEDAKLRNSNAQQCYDVALTTFKNIDYVATTTARQCQEISKCSIKENLKFMDNYMNTGLELIKQLDTVIPDCYQKHSRITEIIQLHNCISEQLEIIKISVKKLKTDASTAKAISKNAIDAVIRQYDTCINEAYSTARSNVAEARSTATKCLNEM
ncbi:uncharacterized protein LOC105205669 [Solenopsis invicta]|uniref:uncharacterized protein LOC105205669 n=1 Tax=Solenopsis invicta TaxID=13686 RepID=UPI0001FEF060|nr:uncharacterized protein LOC105205669 [Solenopsis invicta]